MKKVYVFIVVIVACVSSMASIQYIFNVYNASRPFKINSSWMSSGNNKSADWWRLFKPEHTYLSSRNHSPIITSTPTTTGLSTTEEPCRETSNFVFIKTHKAGSTTLKSITSRFGYFRNLSFLLGSQQVVGHVFGIRLDSKVPNIMPPIGVETGDYANYRNYNISDVHVYFHEDIMKKLMNPAPDLKFITILRQPAEQWLSNFHYYRVFQEVGLNIEQLNQTLLPFLKLHPRKMQFNRQSTDLGISSEVLKSNSTKSLKRKLDRLNKLLSFALITEYFDESLLILRRMFCWSFEDILYVKKRAQPERLVVNNETISEIKRLNWADSIIYDYYLEQFWQKVEDYGPKFERDLSHFRDLLKKWSDTCVETRVAEVSEDKYIYIQNYAAQNSSVFCWALVNTKFHLEIELVRRQGRKSDVRWENLDV